MTTRFDEPSPMRSPCALLVSITMALAPVCAGAAEPAPQTEVVPLQRVTSPTPESPTPSDPPATEPEGTPVAESEASPAAEPEAEASPSFDAFVKEAVARIDAGHPAEGAQQLSDAYVMLPVALRVGDWGRYVVVRASQGYRLAGPDPTRLEAEQVLLTAYFADLGEARAAGRPTVPPDEYEQQLSDRLTAVEEQLAHRSPGSDEVGPIDAQTPVAPPVDPRDRAIALTLLSVGAAGLVAGGVMVGVGAKAAADAEELRRMTPFDQADEARRAKTGGAMLATFGALIASGSIMMVGVGSSRLGELRERTRVSLVPMRRGLALRGRF